MRIRFAEQHFDAAPIGPVDHEHTTDRRARCSGEHRGIGNDGDPHLFRSRRFPGVIRHLSRGSPDEYGPYVAALMKTLTNAEVKNIALSRNLRSR